jgi:hypothetical protein
MKKLLPVILIVALSTIACGSSSTSPATEDTLSDFAIKLTESAATMNPKWTEAAQTLDAALTPQPSETPGPTETPEATDTPKPTNTPVPPPDPVVIEGNSDSVQEYDLTDFGGSAVAHFTNSGSGNFAVWTLDANNEQIDLLINTIGKYDGFVPLNFFKSDTGTKLQITSSGSWKLELLPLEWIRDNHRLLAGGNYVSGGDDVLVVIGAPAIANFSSPPKGNFAIWAIGDDGRDLIVNEIAPYTGTVPLKSGVFLLIVTAEGPWSVRLQ